ncbi:hypothetical protein KWH04_24045, partial [Xanthomonas campestris pv. trichodesmae]|nr:hypothetical protein [Xanthomonas campestris pv. trichodesmae]
MKLRIFTLAVAIACAPPVLAKGPPPPLSNAQIKTVLIRELIRPGFRRHSRPSLRVAPFKLYRGQ